MDINSIPVIFTRGSHYQIGFNIGKTFGLLIQDFLNDLKFYNEVSLPLYQLPEGQEAYKEVLHICTSQFPQYVDEIRGMADGMGISFHKLFILHVEYLMTADVSAIKSPKGDHGCTDIMCNNDNDIIMGHTEDAYPECFGRTYIVHAEIVDENGQVLEQFASICYPGFLPGYTMGFNNHGMVHSINTVNPEKRNPSGTPREFLARAILGSKSIEDTLSILKNPGYGIADGLNLNVHFANQAGPKLVYSIEVGPSENGKGESEIDILEVPVGESYFHCNRYTRLNIPNMQNFFAVSTDFRQETLESLPKAHTIEDIKKQLSDTSNSTWPVFRLAQGEDKGRTVMTGIFELSSKCWFLYTSPAATSDPTAIIKLPF